MATASNKTTTTKKTTDDQSFQFSLSELLKLEDERIQEQARDRADREAAAAAERAANKQREAAEVRARMDAEEEQRRAELESIARREATAKAIIEQAKIEVEIKARAEERELERRHEIEMQKIRLEGKKNQLGPLLGATLFGGVVMMVVALGVHFGVTQPTAERRSAQLEQTIAAANDRSYELDRRVKDGYQANDELQKKLDAANAQIAELRTKPVTKTTSTTPTTIRVNPQPIPAPPPPPAPVCLKGDPLCPTI